MRTLAIGDIHGCFRSLRGVVEAAAVRDDDFLITLGDYIDRGPDAEHVIEWVMERARAGRLVPLKGNHELMILAARSDAGMLFDWLDWGGDATLRSYGHSLEDVPKAHWDFLEYDCRDYYETPTHFFVHATADPNLPLDRQSEMMLFWEKFRDPPPHQSGKIMICGHTAQSSGRPRDVGHAICIDTCAYGGGWLTCLDVDSRRYWQANEHGETREATLEPAP
jgi:serine/threonine protein phosphatase 1